VLISGDQVLPRITSNTSVYPTEPHANPMHEWLSSIARLRQRVPDTVLVLPSHNEPFIGLHSRLSMLEESTLNTIERIRAALIEPKRVVDLVRTLFRPSVASDPVQLHLATGEVIAGLNYLLDRGTVNVSTADERGAVWYECPR
jgi:hypothetical protein